MILITRPKIDEKILVDQLCRKKINYSFQPLITFKFLKKNILLKKNKIFIIGSRQAVSSLRESKNHFNEILKQGEFIVIGKKVKKALVALGVKSVIRSFNNSDALIQYLIRNKKYLDVQLEYLCGSVINEDFISSLKSNKFKISKKIIYQVKPVKNLYLKNRKLIKQRKIKIVLFYSVYASKIFLKLIKKYNLTSDAYQLYAICFSKRIATAVKDQRFIKETNIFSVAQPDHKNMIKKIQSIISIKL
mgnify:CR=1 FL=1